MSIGKFLQHMDGTYHHHNHRPLGWIFCDLLDYHYGMSAKALLQEEREHHHPLRVPLLACVLLAFKLSNLRVKWGEPIRVDNDESDTTAAEFDEMWKDGEPTETVGLLDLKDWDCEEDAVYDWVDDDTMSAEETMRRFEELGPEVTVGNRRNWGLYCNLLGYDWISSKMLGPGRRGFWQSVPRRLGMFTPSWTFMMALTPGSRWAKNYNRETNTWDNAWIELRRR